MNDKSGFHLEGLTALRHLSCFAAIKYTHSSVCPLRTMCYMFNLHNVTIVVGMKINTVTVIYPHPGSTSPYIPCVLQDSQYINHV